MKHALLLLLVVFSGVAAAPPEVPQVIRPEVVKAAIDKAQQAMKQQLSKEFPPDKIVVREEAGLFGTVVAVAAFPDAYPGTGVKRVPIDASTGVSYGTNGERTFADFARERGWTTTLPDQRELVRFMNTALFDGMAMLDSEPPPRIKADKGVIVIELVRRYMPSHAGEWLIVTVPKAGPEVLERRPMQR